VYGGILAERTARGEQEIINDQNNQSKGEL